MTHQYIYLKTSFISKGLEKNDVGRVISRLSPVTTEIEFLRTQTIHVVDNQNYGSFLIEETGDRFDYKVCDRCYKLLDTELDFENNRIKKGGVITKRPSCRDCRKIKNGLNISAHDRRIWDAKKPVHGSLFKCPICDKDSIVGITKIVLDHNHTTGKVRGWICESCNTGIGRFDDDPDVLTKGIDWLM